MTEGLTLTFPVTVTKEALDAAMVTTGVQTGETTTTVEKQFYFRPVGVEPLFKGIYADPVADLAGFKFSVNKSINRRRKWGEDDAYDEVMRHFGEFKDPDEPQQLIFGWANVTVAEDGTPPADWQGDIIPTDDLEEAAYNYVLNFGMAGMNHEWSTECGWIVESMMFTKEKMNLLGIPEGVVPEGWWIGFYIPDPSVYKKVIEGDFNMFSIQGTGRRIPLEQTY